MKFDKVYTTSNKIVIDVFVLFWIEILATHIISILILFLQTLYMTVKKYII